MIYIGIGMVGLFVAFLNSEKIKSLFKRKWIRSKDNPYVKIELLKDIKPEQKN